MESKGHSETNPASLDDCHRSVFNIIAERSPCTEPRLFITAINSGLQCFDGRPLADVRELLGQCVQDLEAGGLVEVVDDEIVIKNPANPTDDDRREQTAESTLNLSEVSTNQGSTEETPWSGKPQPHTNETHEAGRAYELPTEDMDAAPPESVEEGDILDLSGELEIAPEALDEALNNREPADAPPPSATPQARLASTDDAQDSRDPSIEDSDARCTEGAEDVDASDLIDEPEVVPEELEEGTIDRDHAKEEAQAGSGATDSSEDAAETTRKEIIAAMRQVVSGDEEESGK